MSKKKKRFFSVFASICSAGIFVGFAAGIQWGTGLCGVLSLATLILAGMLSLMSAE